MRLMTRVLAATAITAVAGATSAMAQQAGQFTLGFGLGTVVPKSDNGVLAGAQSHASNSTWPTFTFEYFVKDNLGVEVLAALPFDHKVKLDGLGEVATVWQLPPTLSIQYHFQTGSAFTPFVGAGLNYTTFFREKAEGALAGHKIRLGDSVGAAMHLGFDYAVSDRGSVRLDARWINIDSKVKLDGADIGKAHIDPWVFGIAYVLKF